MEIKTNIQEISGSYYILVPKSMADYFKLKKCKGEVKIKDIDTNKAELTFPLW